MIHRPGFATITRILFVVALLAGSALLLSETTPPFSPNEKAFYADEATINFVRPGLTFRVLGHEVLTDGTVRVRFSLTDPRGLGLDREGIVTPGTVATSFVLTTIPRNNKFHQAYTVRNKVSTFPSTVGRAARQAAADAPAGTYEKVSDGVYWYRFTTKLPTGYDRTATHAIGIYGNRNLSEFDLGTNYASTVYYFVPDGTAVGAVRDVIKTESCNKCHVNLNFHGGSRRGLDMCVLCHTPAYRDVPNTNPETGASMDMTVMTHKIHMGANLPSVAAGGRYWWVGFGNAVTDFSEVHLPSEPVRCKHCHEQGTAAQARNWQTAPSRDACGACHDNINWTTGANHQNLPQPDDTRCGTCHPAQGEVDYDSSVAGAHTHPFETSLIAGLVAEVKSVENARPGQRISVSFTMKDKKGAPIDITKINRVALVLSGNTLDYSSPTASGMVSENPVPTAVLRGDTYTYQFTNVIPADAKGTWTVGIEARASEVVLAGTRKQRTIQYGADNKEFSFSVDGTALVQRRVNVTTERCNQCHSYISFHGTNRNRLEHCVLCHNPIATDQARGNRPAAQGIGEAVDMTLMIHRIHAGNRQIRDYTIYGNGQTPHNYNKIVFSADLRNCGACHVNNTHTLVPSRGTLNKNDPRGWINPVGPTSAACLGCHTSKDVASHALANTTTLGESCGACHGPNSEFSILRVHAQ